MAKEKEEKFDFSLIVDDLKSRGLINFDYRIVDDALCCKYSCRSFVVNLKFEEVLESVSYEFGFKYNNNDQAFDLYDVLNALDINDFSDYSYTAVQNDINDIKNNISKMLDAINKFSYDIEKAGESPYLERMIEYAKHDNELMDSNKITIKMILRASRLQSKMQRDKTEKSKNAFLKEMKARDKKGLLTTYDKRFVEYIEQGYAIPDNESSSDLETVYTSAAIKCYGICGAIGFAIAFLILLANIVYVSINGVAFYSGMDCIFTAFEGFLLSYVISIIFGTKIINMLTKNQYVDKMKEFRKNRNNDDSKVRQFAGKYIFPVLAVVTVIGVGLVICSKTYITDNAVVEHELFSDTSYYFSDMTVYQNEGFTDDDGEYCEYKYPSYVFEVKDYCGEISTTKNKGKQERINKIFEKNGIKPILIRDYYAEKGPIE